MSKQNCPLGDYSKIFNTGKNPPTSINKYKFSIPPTVIMVIQLQNDDVLSQISSVVMNIKTIIFSNIVVKSQLFMRLNLG